MAAGKGVRADEHAPCGAEMTPVESPLLAGLDSRTRSANRSPVQTADTPEVRARFEAELALVEAVVRQVCKVIGEVLPRDELTSFGRGGLLEAARRFDPDRGVSFRRFAHYRVRGAILDGMRSHLELPRRAHEKVRALRAASSVTDGVYEDTAAAVAAGVHGPAADQRLADHLANLATAMAVGIGAQLAQGEEGDLVAVDAGQNPEEQLASAELMVAVQSAIAELPVAEATLVRRHILGEESIDKVASELGLSRSWGCRLLARGVATLSRRLRSGAM